jgi:titin
MALPAAPSNLVATAASSSEIDLAWTNNEPSATGTKIYKSTDGVNFTWSYVVGQGVNNYAVTGLSGSTTYYFEVAAYDTAGTSAYSNTSSATTSSTTAPASASASAPASSPAAPSGLSATAVYYNRINLAWTNNATNQNGFLIEESTDGINFTTIASVGADITSYWVNQLSQMTTYYFRVIAYNTAGSSDPSNTINVTTPNYLA